MKPRLPVFATLALSITAFAADDRLEAEWRLEARLRAESSIAAKLTTAEDAAGGCDGVTNGKWGFHTGLDDNPWWQVDLGEVRKISQVRIWNRSDHDDAARRAANFQLLLSDDGGRWTGAYRHDGRIFFGYHMPDRSPLTVRLTNAAARFVRIQLPGKTFLHLDEVEVIAENGGNIALHRPADQSSLSEWSAPHGRSAKAVDWAEESRRALDNTAKLLARQSRGDAGLESQAAALRRQLDAGADAESIFPSARQLQRRAALGDPLLDFDTLVFTKRAPGVYSHMSDQYYGWWSRPGGGIHLLRGFKSDHPVVVSLTDTLFGEPGSFLRPALSYDAGKILFAWCRHYPGLVDQKDKLNKSNIPEDAFYHLYEMKVDGTGLRRLTHGKYDDFDGRYLPGGRIVFVSTRRGQSLQVGKSSAAATLTRWDLPDCYVRCGGDASRPVAVYTLHTMDADGGDLTPISPFEMFEWEPSVGNDGSILYSRWDYVDRDNMPYMKLWAINPDGTDARIVYGNYTKAPHCTFEPRAVPGSRKIIFTASGHHSQTMGSLVLLDPTVGVEGDSPVTRLTPETPFPEIEGWPSAYYANPWPLSEQTLLVAWGVEEDAREGRTRPKNGMGLYLFNAGVGRELLFRDPGISSMYPLPLKAFPTPPALASNVRWDGPQEGRFLIADVARGLKSVHPGEIKALRIVAVPAKTQPWMNNPPLGLTHDDPGKAVLGVVPVESDGSAYFRAPSGVALFFQALDAKGRAVQTMRSATHVQPGQTLSCTGCHDPRRDAPPPSAPLLAARREPSRITVGPEGSWTMRFDTLIQPLLDAKCIGCHAADSPDAEAAKLTLTAGAAYDTLTRTGDPSLNDIILAAYREGISPEGGSPTMRSSLYRTLSAPAGHHGLTLDAPALARFAVWMDTYAQRNGVFSAEQERELQRLRREWADLLAEPSSEQASAGRLP
jgi:Hydrazine synthase alpha subunit middle domain/F5/8 type C domain